MRCERGQGAVEWIGLVSVLALAMLALVAAGMRMPGAPLARALADQVLCAASLADRCGDEPALIAAYGSEVGELVRRHMPMLVFEKGSRALPVDFRRCRSSDCGDGPEEGLVDKTDEELPVTAFVHVVDCREEAGRRQTEGADCSGERAGNLYAQLWFYYADSATLRGVPVAGEKGYHLDDWESVQLRFRPDGSVDQRASSHHGYNYARGVGNWGSDADIDPLNDVAQAIGARPENGWGPETHYLFVSGGSHAGNSYDLPKFSRYTPGPRIHLIPLEQIAASDRTPFAVSPPWLKQVWFDPEAEGTS